MNEENVVNLLSGKCLLRIWAFQVLDSEIQITVRSVNLENIVCFECIISIDMN